MPRIQHSAQVNYSVSEMYALVNDIEAYPSFLEGCRVAKILKRDVDHLESRLVLEKGLISYDFTTRNRLFQDSRIEMCLLNGAFKSLKGVWHFIPVGADACRIDFDLEYQSFFPLVDFAVHSFLEGLASSLVESFCSRAQEVYGIKGK